MFPHLFNHLNNCVICVTIVWGKKRVSYFLTLVKTSLLHTYFTRFAWVTLKMVTEKQTRLPIESTQFFLFLTKIRTC